MGQGTDCAGVGGSRTGLYWGRWVRGRIVRGPVDQGPVGQGPDCAGAGGSGAVLYGDRGRDGAGCRRPWRSLRRPVVAWDSASCRGTLLSLGTPTALPPSSFPPQCRLPPPAQRPPFLPRLTPASNRSSCPPMVLRLSRRRRPPLPLRPHL